MYRIIRYCTFIIIIIIYAMRDICAHTQFVIPLQCAYILYCYYIMYIILLLYYTRYETTIKKIQYYTYYTNISIGKEIADTQ